MEGYMVRAFDDSPMLVVILHSGDCDTIALRTGKDSSGFVKGDAVYWT